MSLEDLPDAVDGFTGGGLYGGPRRPSAMVNRRLSDPDAEATVLHEAAHWHLGHEDEGSGYEAARVADEGERRDHHRAGYEHAANERARAWIEGLRGSGLLTDADASLAFLDKDDARFT